MSKDFYIDLDIGTDSIGWAVTDLEYKLIRKRGKDFWGSYLFDEAQSAIARRTYRSARRRIARTTQRLKLLQSLFAEEIAKIDPTFFLRFKNSALYLEDKDKRVSSKNVLFADVNYCDKHFYQEYPTIHHLRNDLIDHQPRDVRFLYLAVHHILKNRGHFLFEGQNFNAQDTENTKKLFQELNVCLAENEFSTFSLEHLEAVIGI